MDARCAQADTDVANVTPRFDANWVLEPCMVAAGIEVVEAIQIILTEAWSCLVRRERVHDRINWHTGVCRNAAANVAVGVDWRALNDSVEGGPGAISPGAIALCGVVGG